MRGILAECVTVAGRINAVATGTVSSFNAGQAYVGTKPLMVTQAVAAGDTYNGGFRYRSDGALRLVDATAGLPANSQRSQEGIAQSPTGQVCYTSDAVAAGSPIHGGIATTHDGRVYIALV